MDKLSSLMVLALIAAPGLTRATDREPSPASVADAEKYVGKTFWIKHERVCWSRV